MRLSLPLVLLAALFLGTWSLWAAPSLAMDHAAHGPAAAADDGGAQQPGAGHRPGCCSVEGGMHCAGPGAGLFAESPLAGPVEAFVVATTRSEASALAARSPSPPAKPPRA